MSTPSHFLSQQRHCQPTPAFADQTPIKTRSQNQQQPALPILPAPPTPTLLTPITLLLERHCQPTPASNSPALPPTAFCNPSASLLLNPGNGSSSQTVPVNTSVSPIPPCSDSIPLPNSSVVNQQSQTQPAQSAQTIPACTSSLGRTAPITLLLERHRPPGL
mmetsp:Transcript_13710/g.24057  ORF Transcript_13710/g.24057 Transcript_13710/m.24057 type:complete len:162 (-) Transcript_13710:478-963(-)|eukprot:CAMPEP_0119112346 /NCGR_PEP_ID=MMETSP1180-20130426/39865_1 /TAXON_ID=3052 ORGANISM="Chlamydomonas cf sp, Strain CCMP681" /NCGR_SAMPLE_ID=MMETSP1180 /ASSEMBLY_ACC=CAM_ASM_000741 /LENGTH=161 /DNA_ID=CAMNT_0007099809 /DNA_START=48 /DNA_END=533 /DNA_ORIENTATION=+